MSTIHTANQHVPAKRRHKTRGIWTVTTIKKPLLMHEHNAGMLSMDKSDQIIGTYNVLRKCARWWKTLFFQCVDIACINSFVLYQAHRSEHPDVPELAQNVKFDHLAVWEQLIQQIFEYDDVKESHAPNPPIERIRHQPRKMEKGRNLKLCYQTTKSEIRTNVMCSTCQVYLCFTSSRDCFSQWRSSHNP